LKIRSRKAAHRYVHPPIELVGLHQSDLEARDLWRRAIGCPDPAAQDVLEALKHVAASGQQGCEVGIGERRDLGLEGRPSLP
jgi:hypothetical protein